MLPLLLPPVLSTAIQGLSLSVVRFGCAFRPDEAALASTWAPKLTQSSVERATPIAGPPIVALFA